MIITLYAGMLGICYIGLSFYVIKGRFKNRVSIGDGGSEDMQKRIRLHGNFMEYVPLALILIFLVEGSGFPPIWTHVLGGALVVARLLHIYGFALKEGTSFGRFVGTLTTFIVIVSSSVLCIYTYFMT
jgi:uncharacterized membrane protein YecN with MAPEG domain